MKLVNALRKAVEQAGVTIYEQSPVMGIKEGKQIELNVADKYKVTADSIVLATNGYTSKLGYFSGRVFPVHAQSAVTEPLSKNSWPPSSGRVGCPTTTPQHPVPSGIDPG